MLDDLGPDSTPLEREEAIKRIRAKMMVTDTLGDEDDEPEKIFVDFAQMSPEQMLADYTKFLDNYDTVPFDPEGKHIRLYRGQWSIISGFPGAGKTTMLRQLVAHLLSNGNGVFVFSGEDDPSHYLIELTATAFGVLTPTAEQIGSFIETFGDKLYIWGTVSVVDHKKILATISHLAKHGKIQHAIIDSLTTTDIRMDDYETQRQFANHIRVTSIARGVHIHLVAHPKKPMAPDSTPRLEDVAGASDLGRLTFNGFFIRRGPEAAGREGVYSSLFVTLKQRTKGWIGELSGFFYRDMRQHQRSPTETEPIHYMPDRYYAPKGIDDDPPINVQSYVQRAEYDNEAPVRRDPAESVADARELRHNFKTLTVPEAASCNEAHSLGEDVPLPVCGNEGRETRSGRNQASAVVRQGEDRVERHHEHVEHVKPSWEL